MRADIVAGAVFPDYELTDHAGKRRKLSDLQGPDPMVLVLSRGGFCPKDRRQAEGLVQLHHEMEVGYSRLVTISTDNMLLTNEYRTCFCQLDLAPFDALIWPHLVLFPPARADVSFDPLTYELTCPI